jgi:hypothetical protein
VRIPAWLKVAAGVGAAVASANWFLRKVWFYRDPLRIPPPDPNLILAPCDGKVVYIRPVSADGTVFAEKLGRPIPITEITRADWDGVSPEGWLIGVYMSPLDVHYNYAPIAGTVRRIVYTPARANLPMVDLWEYVSMAWLRRAVDLLGKNITCRTSGRRFLLRASRCASRWWKSPTSSSTKSRPMCRRGSASSPRRNSRSSSAAVR